MDNPWASAWEPPSESTTTWTPPKPVHDEEADIGLPSWHTNDTQWSSSTHEDDGPLWTSSAVEEHVWAPSTYDKITISRSASTSDSPPDVHDSNTPSPSPEAQDIQYGTPTEYHSALSSQKDTDIVPHTDVPGGAPAPVSPSNEDDEPDAWEDSTILNGPDDEWASAWNATPDSPEKQEGTQPPDEWETARQEKEKLNRAVPPELLASILRQCQDALDEIWPESEAPTSDVSEKSWRTGFDGLENITKLLNELIPDDFVLPPAVQYPTTATAKAMNEALRLTRHSTSAGSSPLTKLFASKGSLDWQRSVVSTEDAVPDATPVGWRILDKEEHRSTTDATKPKRGASGLLSFWNRRAPSVSSLPEEVREASPSRRTSIGSGQSTNRDASPVKPPSTTTPPPQSMQQAPPEIIVAPTTTPSAVSKFLNRFSRTKSTGSHHSSIALSVNDLEYLSDIVPSASDPDDEQEGSLKAPSNMTLHLPAKLPPPLPPPPKPPATSPFTFNENHTISAQLSRPPQYPGQNSSPLLPSLPPPLSPKSISTPTRSLSPVIDHPYPSISIIPSRSSSTVPKLPSPPPPSQIQSSFSPSPPPKTTTPLSLPPLIPPPPISPPQTPRPTAVNPFSPPLTSLTSSSSSYMWPSSTSSRDEDASDEEFFALSSRSPYRPSHASSDSASIRSPESQNSGDRLRSARSSMSQSFDDFDDFVSSPSRKHPSPRSPSPPPLPAKNTPPMNYRMPTHTSRPSVDHQRTQSLIDKASTTKGTWPSPATNVLPLRPIPPPPVTEDLLGFGDPPASPPQPLLGTSIGLGTKAIPPLLSLHSAVESRVHQPPRSSSPLTTTSQPLMSFPPLAFMSTPPPLSAKPPPQAASKPPQTGGLSAQDLLFFEGL